MSVYKHIKSQKRSIIQNLTMTPPPPPPQQTETTVFQDRIDIKQLAADRYYLEFPKTTVSIYGLKMNHSS